MKKYLLISALGLASLAFGQNYPNGNYPNNYPNGGYENNNGWGDDQDGYYDGVDPYAYGAYDYSNANFPDDYYYDYPTDYYPNDYYQGYYNDYRNSIVGINWNNLFVEFRLSPFQVRQIVLLNRRFSNYDMWFSYYGMNPDRWYYDRFYALQQILGPRVFVVFQNRYYRGYEPWVYFRNYRTTYYVPRYHVMPRYRNVDVYHYRVDRGRFYENHRDHGNHYGWNQPKNPHGGFENNPRNGNNGNHGGNSPRNNQGNGGWNNPRNNQGNGGGFANPRNNQGNNDNHNWNQGNNGNGGNNGNHSGWGGPRNENPQGNSTPRGNGGGFRGGNEGNNSGGNGGFRGGSEGGGRQEGGFRNGGSNTGGNSGGFRGGNNGGGNRGGFGQRLTSL